MTSTHLAEQPHRTSRRVRRRAGHGLFMAPLVVVIALAVGAIAVIGYLLWPRWPGAAIAPDAPAFPITVAGVAFNVPPAAIRVKVQRRPGAHERVDLVFLWPSLEPPDPNAKPPPPTGTTPAPNVPASLPDVVRRPRKEMSRDEPAPQQTRRRFTSRAT